MDYERRIILILFYLMISLHIRIIELIEVSIFLRNIYDRQIVYYVRYMLIADQIYTYIISYSICSRTRCEKKKITSDRSSNDIILYSLEKEQNFFGKRLEQIKLIVKSFRRIQFKVYIYAIILILNKKFHLAILKFSTRMISSVPSDLFST